MKTIWLVPGWFGLSFGPAPSGRSSGGTKTPAAVNLRQVVRSVVRWHERAVSRRNLCHLDDRLLADIGLTREDVDREVRKPFWMA